MSLQQIKREVERFKESTDIGHLQELLKRNPEDLTDSELCQLLMKVPVKQLYPDIIKVANKRAGETGGKSLQGVSTNRLREILDELREIKECGEK